MNVIHKFSVLTCVLFLAMSFATAQDQTSTQTTPPQNPPAGAPGGHRHMRGQKGADRLQMMSQRLNLTDDQKAKIQPILQDEAQKIRAIHKNTSLTPEERKSQMQQVRQSTKDQIKPLLTADQVAKLDDGRAKGPGGAGRGNPPDVAQWMDKNLNLTPDQKSKIDPLFASQRQQAQTIRQDSTLTPEQKQAKIEELRKSTHQQVMTILTPEQQAQLKQMHGKRMHRGGPPAGAPPAGQTPPPPPGA